MNTPLPSSVLRALRVRVAMLDPEARSAAILEAVDGDAELAARVAQWIEEREAAELAAQTLVDPPASPAGDATLVDEADGGGGSGGYEDATLVDDGATLAPDDHGEPNRSDLGSAEEGGSSEGRSASSSSAAAPLSSMPRDIAGFEVESLLGAGGMGAVYRCRQQSPDREVAVKLVKPGFADSSAMQRFEFEIATLARLVHPNIARLYEAGIFDSAQGPTPFVAMEMVQGARTITDHADAHDLDLRARLELFAEACEGVAFGHGRGVIHRDLKPPNLLVDASGVPKVIDFGVALATGGATDRHELVGTLQYMAPEQAARGDVGTATDVHALGLILFELLAGRPPYVISSGSLAAAITQVQQAEPPRLASIVPEVPPDVDAIVARALARDPDGRYANASELGADVRRYLRDEPTEARPPTAWETARRFARRHRIETAFAFATALALVVGVIGIAIFAFRAEGARIESERANEGLGLALERLEAEQVRTERSLLLFLGVLGELTPDELGETVLRSMTEGIDRELARRGASDDEVADAILQQRDLAGIFGPTDVGVRIIERHLEQPTERLLPLIRDDLRTRANLEEFLGDVLLSIGRLEGAEIRYRAARERWSGLESRSGENRRRVTANLAGLLVQSGRQDEGLELLNELVADGTYAGGGLDRTGLEHLNSRAVALASVGRLDEAKADFERVLAEYGDEEGDGEGGAVLAQVRSNLGGVHLSLGNPEAALQNLEVALAAFDALGARDASEIGVRVNLGRAAFQLGRFDEAGGHFRDAVELSEGVLASETPLAAEVRHELGQFLFQVGEHAEAVPLMREAWQVRQRVLGETASPTLTSGLFLVLSEAASGDLTTAISRLDVVDGAFLSVREESDPDRINLLYFFSNYANAVGTVEGERAATVALERLFDACAVASRPEIEAICGNAATLLPKFYDAMIDAEPDADWAERRAERFDT